MHAHQQALLDRLEATFRPDDRFRALFLTGSLGRGEGDEFSDIDTMLVTTPDAISDVLTRWAEIAEPLGPFVMTKRIPHTGVVNHVLPGWLRWDVNVVPADHLPRLVDGRLTAVFEKDEFPRTAAEPREVNLHLVADITVEFLRCLALLPVVVGRGEFVGGRSGVELLRTHTIALMRELDQPGARSGALHLHTVITPEHYAALAELPPAAATLQSVLDGHQALRDLFLPLARVALGERFPAVVADEALARVGPLLG